MYFICIFFASRFRRAAAVSGGQRRAAAVGGGDGAVREICDTILNVRGHKLETDHVFGDHPIK